MVEPIVTTDLYNALNIFPSFLFIADYIVILFLWIETISENLHNHRKRNFFIIVSLILFVSLVMFTIYIIEDEESVRTKILDVIFVYVAGLYVIVSVAFIINGILMSFVNSTYKAYLIYPRVKVMTGIVVFFFLIRAAFGMSNLLFANTLFPKIYYWFDIVYWTLLEIIPLILMLLILQNIIVINF
eukprot:TRINITY_DN3411_c0_g1_i2.p1 TRINITY_DN3411_c0_g1~~TRINITY_DN3411_c0_g1_i2.p1  ORF type:complete len:186 (-),score=10.56 TRINITY_DN3411_c0_g1_i2:27-584(-)